MTEAVIAFSVSICSLLCGIWAINKIAPILEKSDETRASFLCIGYNSTINKERKP
jgi:hypothetical protein